MITNAVADPLSNPYFRPLKANSLLSASSRHQMTDGA
jgi:hypothetical protein